MAAHWRATCTWLAVAAALLARPAAAEPTPIPIGDGATWRNDEATLEMPPALAGFARDGIVDYGDQRLDVAGAYRESESETTATLYLYRAPLPDVALWHDRALASIRPQPTLGTPDLAAAATASFAPPRGEVASGLRTVVPLNGAGFRSTGLALFPLGEWLVKVRMSSRTLEPASLAARLDAFVDALAYTPPAAAAAPAQAMAPCETALQLKSAKRARKPDMGTQILLSTFASIAQDKEGDGGAEEAEDKAAPRRFCRDAASRADVGVYRLDGAEDAYVIALGDAGVSVGVHRQPAVGLLGGSGGEDFWIDLSTHYQTATYRGFRTLPRPEQVLEVIEREGPITSVVRDGSGNTTINLSD